MDVRTNTQMRTQRIRACVHLCVYVCDRVYVSVCRRVFVCECVWVRVRARACEKNYIIMQIHNDNKNGRRRDINK